MRTLTIRILDEDAAMQETQQYFNYKFRLRIPKFYRFMNLSDQSCTSRISYF